MGRLYSSTRTPEAPLRDDSRRQAPRTFPLGTTNSPAAVPKAFVVTVAVPTTWLLPSCRVTVMGAEG